VRRIDTAFCLGALTCIALLGCGSRPSPAVSVTGYDSSESASETEITAPAATVEVETAGTSVPDSPAAAVPAAESVPTVIIKAFPSARAVRSVAKPFPYRVILDSTGTVVGYEAFSDSAGVTGRGYGGMVPVQVFFDPRGRPVRIYILGNCETPAYLDLVLSSGLLDSLLTCDPTRPDSVDAVTLATSSSHAIISGVTELGKRVASEIAAKSGTRGR
jgi:uncharacterized protein with FMN-binding domain